MTTTGEREYVLGTHDVEIERLGLQHRVWRSRVLDVWTRAGLSPGQTVVDLGAGPGYATLDLAERVGSTGRVYALDRSRRFLTVLESALADRGWSHVSTAECDLDEGPWPDVQADLIWCRWVAAFVRDPRALVARAVGRLKPGGAVVFHEYLNYAAWQMLPPSAPFTRFVTAVIAAWRAAGGEPDIGVRLPAWLEEAGCRIEVTRPIQEVVTPADEFWRWPRAFVESGLARLTALGALTDADAADIWRAFLACEAAPSVRMATPTVLEIVARRR